MGWFKRLTSGIQTTTRNKKEAPEGVWFKCKRCGETTLRKDMEANYYKCPNCNYHDRIGSREYFALLFDGQFEEFAADMEAVDMLEFKDLKTYKDRLKVARKKTGLTDAIRVARGKINRRPLVIACMDFSFIGGSMGAVVGEKISRAIDLCLDHESPLLIISKSGGARMMESAFSLMQMAKTSAKLTRLAEARLPYISLMTDPTTGGVTASYSMLGDLNLGEPGALIGFAGPRVIKETIKKDLPEGFQRAEFLLEKGFLDRIVDRKDLRRTLAEMLALFAPEARTMAAG